MVRYVHLPGAAVDTALLEDATRRGTLNIALLELWVEANVLLRLQKLHRKRRSHGDAGQIKRCFTIGQL